MKKKGADTLASSISMRVFSNIKGHYYYMNFGDITASDAGVCDSVINITAWSTDEETPVAEIVNHSFTR